MTPTEFNNLDVVLQGIIVSKHSKFLNERIIDKHKILIYSVLDFYVELYYSIEDNKILSLKALENISDWEGYMNSINLDLLY